jgi:formylglycine-generating enzyme required for sulfatase activity
MSSSTVTGLGGGAVSLRSAGWRGSVAFVAAALLVSGCGQDLDGSVRPVAASELVERPLLVMKRLPPGSFLMGSAEGVGTDAERPQIEVRIAAPFLIGRTEITRGQFRAVLGRGAEGDPDGAMAPVSWFDAIEFCVELSRQEGLDPAYEIDRIERRDDGAIIAARVRRLDGRGYRLPSESEWEYACRAGSEGRWGFGDNASRLSSHGWHQAQGVSSPQTVGMLAPNAWGLHDMHGNVWEWCEDEFLAGFDGHPVDGSVRSDRRGTGRVMRGGGYLASADYCRCGYRNRGLPGMPGGAFGFRVVLAEE